MTETDAQAIVSPPLHVRCYTADIIVEEWHLYVALYECQNSPNSCYRGGTIIPLRDYTYNSKSKYFLTHLLKTVFSMESFTVNGTVIVFRDRSTYSKFGSEWVKNGVREVYFQLNVCNCEFQ
ncbi:hypothetical protein Trydic_g974 [Trypoxylus dichotomus]